ncbi:MAG TPA: hypothetical protein VEK11_13790 [Thermoanaerobaculia bacterium]|nr:hypothetical protein [Thermoanaerobaculia bacterium]
MTAIDVTPRPRVEAGANPTMLTGTWVNTNPRSRGIVSMEGRIDGNLLRIRIRGAAENDTVDWGETAAAVYHERNDEGLEQPFVASYDFGTTRVALQGFLRQGVLVILAFTKFDDDSGRANYFSKEFFYRI